VIARWQISEVQQADHPAPACSINRQWPRCFNQPGQRELGVSAQAEPGKTVAPVPAVGEWPQGGADRPRRPLLLS